MPNIEWCFRVREEGRRETRREREETKEGRKGTWYMRQERDGLLSERKLKLLAIYSWEDVKD